MRKIANLTIEEIDYYIEVEWGSGEFPVVGDFVNVTEICTDKQRAEFEKMTLPRYLHADFPNVLEYLQHYRWQVVERCWERVEVMSVNCRRVDPTLI